jgi:hypothetical protein
MHREVIQEAMHSRFWQVLVRLEAGASGGGVREAQSCEVKRSSLRKED